MGSEQTQKSSFGTWAALLLLLATIGFALWLRGPSVSYGLPYFYGEDEAHHFNRVVRMVQKGEWDPHYFHKPSLHFYLRMPIVAAGFLWSVRNSEIRSIKEVQTSDRFGIAQYAFSASHPTLVKFNRAFSLFLSLGVLVFVYLIARELSLAHGLSILAVLITAASPELLLQSAVIGVDIVMSFFVVVAVYGALRVYRNFSLRGLFWVGIACGLAISSKYNALPIAILPILLCASRSRFELESILFAFLAPAVGFFIGSPFILTSFPLFLDQLGYEIWHYGVSGHEGHQAAPGLPQLLFYWEWLTTDGVGLVTAAVALFGVLLVATRPNWRRIIAFAFPILFFTLMVFQRANFTRNMIVFVPFVPIFAALVLSELYRALRRGVIAGTVCGLIAVICVVQPVNRSLALRNELKNPPESRNDLVRWLHEQEREKHWETALDGELQVALADKRTLWADTLDIEKKSALSLYQQGYDQIVVSDFLAEQFENDPAFERVKRFEGSAEQQRIVQSPAISVFRFVQPPVAFAQLGKGDAAAPSPDIVFGEPKDRVCETPNDPSLAERSHCWLSARRSTVMIRDDLSALEVMSPWPHQQVHISGEAGTALEITLDQPGDWKRISIPESFGRKLAVEITTISTPRSAHISSDARRLGLAVRPALGVSE